MNELEYKKIIWQKYHGALIPKCKPHEEIYLNTNEEQELLKKSNAYFLRYTSNWDTTQETEFWYIIKDIEENLEQYRGNKKNQIKKGLKSCIVKKVSNEEIATNGYEVYKKAFDNYKTDLRPTSKEDFYNNTIKATKYDYFAVYEIGGGKYDCI